LIPDVEDAESLVLRQLGSTSLFAARFRETAARALLLPRRRPGMRTPLWQQRKRAADLLAVAARFGSFPALLETYREILRDHFDMPALVDTLRKIGTRTLRVATIDSRVPSPFAASLLFSYVANYIYDGDAPLAERRAQALSVDQAQLRELLGDAELRELLDADAVAALEAQLQHLDDKYKARTKDGLHDLLLRIGDLSLDEIEARTVVGDVPATMDALENERRIVSLPIAGTRRYAAVEDVARYRDALGVPLPVGLPEALLEPVRDPAGDLALRYARSHGPFTAREFAAATAWASVSLPRFCCSSRPRAKSLKANSAPAAPNVSGSIPTFCDLFAGAPWRGFVRKSSPSILRPSAAFSCRGTASARAAVGSRRCSMRSSNSRVPRSRHRFSSAKCFPRASTTTRLRCWTPS
jgi:ATP-dependent Lhr-like helicase